jgi:hypothetical protein
MPEKILLCIRHVAIFKTLQIFFFCFRKITIKKWNVFRNISHVTYFIITQIKRNDSEVFIN